MTYPMTHPFAVFNENPAHRYVSQIKSDSPQQEAAKLRLRAGRMMQKPAADHPIRRMSADEAREVRPQKLAAGACPVCQGPMKNIERKQRKFADGSTHGVCTKCAATLPQRFTDRRAK